MLLAAMYRRDATGPSAHSGSLHDYYPEGLSFLTCSFGQELRGLGIANLAGAMFNTYTTTGSFSRSAVMDQCGAKTQLAAYIQVRTTTACPIKPPAQPVVKSPLTPACLHRHACCCCSPGPQDGAGWMLLTGMWS